MTVQLWITLAAAILGSGSLTAVVTYFLTERGKRKKKAEADNACETAMRNALMFLTLDSLQEQCRGMISRGRRTEAETQQIILRYRTYKDLHGDGWADEIYNAVMQTPLIGD